MLAADDEAEWRDMLANVSESVTQGSVTPCLLRGTVGRSVKVEGAKHPVLCVSSSPLERWKATRFPLEACEN